jgi:hypothetical protein
MLMYGWKRPSAATHAAPRKHVALLFIQPKRSRGKEMVHDISFALVCTLHYDMRTPLSPFFSQPLITSGQRSACTFFFSRMTRSWELLHAWG